MIEQKDEAGTHIDTDDLANGRSGGIEDGLDVVTASLGLGCDVTLDKAAVLVRGDLAREENLAICLDGLRLYFVQYVLREWMSCALSSISVAGVCFGVLVRGSNCWVLGEGEMGNGRHT